MSTQSQYRAPNSIITGRWEPNLLTSALAIAVLLTVGTSVNGQENESRWESRIQQFEQADAEEMPPKGAILFVGSSSIVFWGGLKESMAPLAVINRGFGGSQMHELNEFRDRIVTNYEPRAIVIYEGDNDVAMGKDADTILSTYDDFIAHIDETLPATDICFIAVKPSTARKDMWEEMDSVNTGLRERAASRDDMCYLDIAKPMMEGEEFVREDLLFRDGLHLSRKGYEVWVETIRPVLMERYGPDSDRPATMQTKDTADTEAEE